MRNRLSPHIGLDFHIFHGRPLEANAGESGLFGTDLVNDRPYTRALDSGAEVFVPEFYESNYAYPLVVWLPGSAGEFDARMWEISPRNCLGLQLPAEDAGLDAAALNDRIRTHVTQLRQTWHVHTERIFVAGSDAAAEPALHAFLDKAEWYGGAIAIRGRFDPSLRSRIPFRNPELRGKRLFLTGSTAAGMNDLAQAGRVLSLFGMEVSTRGYDQDGPATPLSDLNLWLMESVCVAA